MGIEQQLKDIRLLCKKTNLEIPLPTHFQNSENYLQLVNVSVLKNFKKNDPSLSTAITYASAQRC
jgi:hypothetical protein